MTEKKTALETAARIADAVTKIPNEKQPEVISFIEGVVAGVGITAATNEKPAPDKSG